MKWRGPSKTYLLAAAVHCFLMRQPRWNWHLLLRRYWPSNLAATSNGSSGRSGIFTRSRKAIRYERNKPAASEAIKFFYLLRVYFLVDRFTKTMKRNPFLELFIVLIWLAAVISCSWQNSGNTNVAANTEVPANLNSEINAGEPESGVGQSSAGEAETLIADLYKQHDSKKSPFFQTADRSRVDRFFTKTTADLIWKDANSSKGEIGAIDFDPLYDAQDVEKKSFSVGKASVNGDTATIAANYTNYGEKKRITYVMKNVAGKWKIDDIKYDAGHAL